MNAAYMKTAAAIKRLRRLVKITRTLVFLKACASALQLFLDSVLLFRKVSVIQILPASALWFLPVVQLQ